MQPYKTNARGGKVEERKKRGGGGRGKRGEGRRERGERRQTQKFCLSWLDVNTVQSAWGSRTDRGAERVTVGEEDES